MMNLPTLKDIELGAEVFLKAPHAQGLTPVEVAAYHEFVDASAIITSKEWDLHILARLLTGDARGALDYLCQKIEDNQPEAYHE